MNQKLTLLSYLKKQAEKGATKLEILRDCSIRKASSGAQRTAGGYVWERV